ncbi:Cell division protein FtsP precursor [Providencia rettgeri]|nr:Cell division protein FtsP precursor [Providencia rettgeri]
MFVLCANLCKCRGGDSFTCATIIRITVWTAIILTLQKIHWSYDGKYSADIWGVNGSSPGPTVKVKNGDDIKLIYSNRLPEAVSMTISGLQIPGTQIGGAARLISPNADWSPVIPIRQNAATLWYHANTQGKWASKSTMVYWGCGSSKMM